MQSAANVAPRLLVWHALARPFDGCALGFTLAPSAVVLNLGRDFIALFTA